jgi:hypothetical protein
MVFEHLEKEHNDCRIQYGFSKNKPDQIAKERKM